jgi:hypothetical protein
MNILTGFTDSPKQTTTIVLDDGSSATFDLEFRPQQRGWFYNLNYKDFTALGQRLVYSENMLHQFRGEIPFGLAVLSTSRNDPMTQSEIALAKTVIILLNADDVKTVELAKFTRND